MEGLNPEFWESFFGEQPEMALTIGQDLLGKLRPPTPKAEPPVLLSNGVLDGHGRTQRIAVLAALKAMHSAGVIVHHGGGAISLPAPPKKVRRPSRTAASTPLDIVRCRCGVMVLRGYHEAQSCSLDTDPLTQAGAATALAAGHDLFTVTSAEKWKRGLPTENSPPTATVHRDHQCNADPIEFAHRRPMVATTKQDNKFDGEPPY
ncbi:hypothetical protein [Gordonia sp. N1V]|uniref:hypothetical protein n=1 Tax=Gordonia sp. N1V TaxID=3034163 RepID=UPI0023E1EF7C|nr:hypothetical protein [Gordonia sp. N1V]MDF3280884.1 hypothetical protein [Gordonia sp. N1V]